MMRKTLAALDGTAESESILPYLEALLAAQDADLTLARVVMFESQRPKAEAYLHKAAEQLRDRGAVVGVKVLVGKPAEALVDLAVREEYALIALCTKTSALKRMILGSVAEEVLHRSSVPVLVVHPLKTALKPQFKRIVVPLDGSHRSASILPHVAALAKALGAKVQIMTTVEPGARSDMPVEVVAKNLFKEQKELHREGLKTDLSIRFGDPAAEILSYGDAQGADLLALSTHGRSGVDRALYGSVAETVLRRGTLPMLILRTAGTLAYEPLKAPAIRAEREKKRAEAAHAGKH